MGRPRVLHARLYPDNDTATQTGMVSGTVTNMMTGKGRFQLQYAGEVGESLRDKPVVVGRCEEAFEWEGESHPPPLEPLRYNNRSCCILPSSSPLLFTWKRSTVGVIFHVPKRLTDDGS